MGLLFEGGEREIIDEILLGQEGVGKEDTPDAFVQVAEERVNHGGFARSHLPGQEDEPLPFNHAVRQEGQGLLVIFA